MIKRDAFPSPTPTPTQDAGIPCGSTRAHRGGPMRVLGERLVPSWGNTADYAVADSTGSVGAGAGWATRPGDGAGRVSDRTDSEKAVRSLTVPVAGETFPGHRIIAFKEGHR